MKIKPSFNKTETGRWNNFDSDALRQFIEKCNPIFVDLPNDDCWQNNDDTVVIQMPMNLDWYQFAFFMALNADEFDFVPVDKKSVIVRLWWD